MAHYTFQGQKLVKTRFKSLGWGFLMGLCLTGLLLFSNDVLGATIFEDDFESYESGTELGVSENWWCNYQTGNGNQPTISEDRAWWGTVKAVRNTYVDNPSASICLHDSETVIEDGTQRIWFYITNDFTGEVSLKLLGSQDVGIRVLNGLVEYIDSNHQWIFLDTFDVYNLWFQLEIGWRYGSYDKSAEVRYAFDGDDWTDWEVHGLHHQFNRVMIWWDTQQPTGTFYFDELEEAPTPCDDENCWACEVYGTCISAGCEWFYSIYLQQSFCVPLGEPTPELCGSFYKCQYCMSQETCEAEWCVWEDRFGLGEKCYMTEPTIPPEQIDWEVPDLEDCGSLSGVEMWLCEIKNDLIGVFMPSQEKVNSLFQTITSVKEKFPFNYIESLRVFFIEIEENLAQEKNIPIKILGQESNVSFAFWEQETEVGGVAETLKNVLFDFTTVIILMGFFVWLLSSIRRFF